MVVEFAKAVALLLALSLIQGFIVRRWPHEFLGRILSGLLFGGICVIGMETPIQVAPGVIFDARSVVLSMSGLFGGPVVGITAGIVAGGYRAWLGGGGAPVGVSVVVSCVLFGLAFWHARRRGWFPVNVVTLLAFGLLIQLAQVYLFTFLPEAVVSRVMENVALPMVLTFTPATALLGILLQSVERQVEIGRSLAESEARFRDIAEVSADWIWEMDADLRFTFLSPRFFALYSIAPEGIIGKTRAEFAHADAEDDHWRQHLETLRDRKPFRDFEYLQTTPSGQESHFKISGKPVYGPDGAFRGYRGTGTDVTAQVRSTKALENSEKLFRTVLDNLPIGINLKDLDGRFLMVNKRLATWYGRPEGTLIGRTATEALNEPAPVQSTRLAQERKLLETGEPLVREELKFRADGVSQYVVINKFPVVDSDGTLIGFGTVSTDISDRKNAEAKVIASKEEAEIANRAKSEFLANMSHELRTPLNSVIGFSQMVINEVYGPVGDRRYREYVMAINESGAHLLKIISDILDISKIEAGEATVEETEVDIGGAVRDCVAMVRIRAEDKNIAVRQEAPEDLPPLRADQRHVKQILLNLLSNAVKFTPDGGRVTVGARVDGENRLEIAIADTGVGIAAADIPKVMLPFGQVADSVIRGHEGTGLGLPICKSLVELHGGDLIIESEVGAGTTVVVRFPPERTIVAKGAPRDQGSTELAQ